MTGDFLTTFHESTLAPRAPLVALVERVMDAEVLSLGRVTKGYVNEVYRAELASAPPVYVRIRRRGGVAFETEAWALGACRRAGVPVPEVHAVTVLEAEAPLEVMVLAAVPGQALGSVWPELSEASRQEVMGRVGAALRALHSVELGGWGRRTSGGGWEYPDWASRAAASVRDREADVPFLRGAGLAEREADALLDIVRVTPLLEAPVPVLCHGDLGLDHLFVDENLTLTGVIDFGMWQGSLRELDFAVLTMYHPDVALAWLESAAPFDEEFYRRVLVEQVNTGMGFFAHDLRQGNVDYADLALTGLRGSLAAWQRLF